MTIMEANSLRGILAAAGVAALGVFLLIGLPLLLNVNPWYVILPIAVITLLVRFVDDRVNRRGRSRAHTGAHR